MRTPAQKQRQDKQYRDSGRYAKVNPCQCCGKSAGIEYYSHRLTDSGDWADTAICLCKRCADATDDLETPQEFLAFKASKKLK